MRDSPFTMYDAEGRVCLVDSEDAAELLADEAFDRLLEAKVQRIRRESDSQRRARQRKRAAKAAAEAERRQHEMVASAMSSNTPSAHGGIAGGAARTIRVAMHALKAVAMPGPVDLLVPSLSSQPEGEGVMRGGAVGDTGSVVLETSESAPTAAAADVVRQKATGQGGPGDVVDDEEAAADARLSAALADVAAAPVLSRNDLACCFFRKSDLNTAFALLNMDASLAVGRAEFATVLRLMAGARRATQVAVGSVSGGRRGHAAEH